MSDSCEKCGHSIAIGEWPYCPHEQVEEYRPFVPYVDYHLLDHPVQINSLADRWRYRREASRLSGGYITDPDRTGMPGAEV